MLIQITNTCRMHCPHCMDNADEAPAHMAEEVFFRTLDVAKALNVRAVAISGGEPTEHPEWIEMVRFAARSFDSVSLVTNGMWLIASNDNDNDTEMLWLLREHDNVKVQVSSFGGFYQHRDEILKGADDFKSMLKYLRLKHRFYVETDERVLTGKMLSLGRAADVPEYQRMADESGLTASCVKGAVAAAQVGLRKTIELFEPKGYVCKPLVDYHGNIKWSESCLCPSFAHVYDHVNAIEGASRKWRPCGRCRDYARMFEKPTKNAIIARAVLGLKEKVGAM